MKHSQKRIMTTTAAILVVLSLAATTTQAATSNVSPPSPDGFDLTICQSARAGLRSTVKVKSVPVAPIDAIFIPGSHRKYEITCIKIFEKGPVLAASQVGLCSTPALIYICVAPVSAPTLWECTPYENYNKDPQTHVMIGGQGEEEKLIKIQWQPQGSGVLCFPRDLTVQVVGASITPEESNLGASIAFIVIASLVFLVVAFFIFYQFRKVMRKFWKKEKARPATHLTESEHHNTIKALNGDTSPNRGEKGYRGDRAADRGIARIDIYDGEGEQDEDMQYASGQQVAVIDDGTMTVRAQPLPKPWWQRYNYDGNTQEPGRATKELDGDGESYTSDDSEGGGGSAKKRGKKDRRPKSHFSSKFNGPIHNSSMRNHPQAMQQGQVESIQRYDDGTPRGRMQNSSYMEGIRSSMDGGGGQGGSYSGRGGQRNLPPTSSSSQYYQTQRHQPQPAAGSSYYNNQQAGGYSGRQDTYDIDY